jgi:hypothetical protein
MKNDKYEIRIMTGSMSTGSLSWMYAKSVKRVISFAQKGYGVGGWVRFEGEMWPVVPSLSVPDVYDLYLQ